ERAGFGSLFSRLGAVFRVKTGDVLKRILPQIGFLGICRYCYRNTLQRVFQSARSTAIFCGDELHSLVLLRAMCGA
ncbi:hypothetical protein, partial [Lentibacter algarum]|uniref:hypothetical protein n=1 Tax=Lentibacter algarum TaxID=576131 RepID=UPI0026E9AB09